MSKEYSIEIVKCDCGRYGLMAPGRDGKPLTEHSCPGGPRWIFVDHVSITQDGKRELLHIIMAIEDRKLLELCKGLL